ncbi:hypothetical protein [Paenibacillus polymyxa]|uniref:DUF7336 domain-containing protein n=1 Tax=Paenibacillus polymyxa (strain SC2) TaxID=886882 RepID=E3EKK2_PAEPS|nr:hypothetical protein [Paenibacillus polymyxa]ADO59834.1 hypothetical protein PPSC2_26005 [Paenibacillus polymyxa SC2]WPQ59935.1 hypothetical protein SKN87_27215 [Paenibacillus polymyxa]
MGHNKEEQLRLQMISDEFEVLASQYFQKNNISTNETLYVLSSYMFSLTNRVVKEERRKEAHDDAEEKVYIVTSGSHSDYRIHRVFFDEELANTYAKSVYDSQVEEWKIDDTVDLKLFKTVTATYIISPSGWDSFNVDISMHNQLDSDKDQIEQSIYFDDKTSSTNPREFLEITRIVPLDALDDEVERRYELLCKELRTKIQELMSTEGWTDEMVDEWLEKQGSWDHASSLIS